MSYQRNADIRLIPLTDTVISKMLESSSAYTSEVIPAGTYTGQDTAISTIGVKSVLITKSMYPTIQLSTLHRSCSKRKMSSPTPTLLSLS